MIDDLFYFLSKEEKEKLKKKYKDTKLSKEEVIKEICVEYNLDYDKTMRRNNLDRDITNISNILANFIKEIIKIFRRCTYNKKLESILETMVKILVFIVIIMVFKLPFIVIDYFVKYISNMLFYPFSYSIKYVSSLFISLVYMLVCITCGIKLFGNYRGIEKKEIDENKIKSVDKDYNYLSKIIRIILYLIVLIPLFILLITNVVLFIISSYLVITGVNIIGVPILFVGLIMIIISIIKLFKDGLYNKKECRLFKLSISTLVFIIGFIISIYNISTFKTPTTLTESDVVNITESKEIKLNDINTIISVRNGKYDLVTDNTLQDNNIKVEVTYYDDYVDVEYSQGKIGDYNLLKFKSVSDEKINYGKFINSIHKDLKRGYIFNYSDLNKIVVKIYANEEVISKLENNK